MTDSPVTKEMMDDIRGAPAFTLDPDGLKRVACQLDQERLDLMAELEGRRCRVVELEAMLEKAAARVRELQNGPPVQ